MAQQKSITKNSTASEVVYKKMNTKAGSKKDDAFFQLANHVVTELVGEEGIPIVHYLKGKSNVSEFKIAEDVQMEIHQTRNILYRLLEHNIVTFKRKKDKIKGWYICYWDLHEPSFPFLKDKIRKNKIAKIKERIKREEGNLFYMCRNACVRMDFEKATDFHFKCPECGEIMQELDNTRTLEFLAEKLKELEA